MALINTLRNRMGKVVVGVIGFSIAAFVGADLLGPNSTLLGNNSTDIGEIAGETVTYQDFIAKQDEITFNFTQNNNGRSPNAAQQNFIRTQTWDALIAEYAFTKQFNALGIEVTDDEVVDMVQGDNISPQIKQAFTDPQTGEFSKENVISYLQNIQNQPPAQQASWYNFERNLGPSRRRIKFDNLLTKTNYATEGEAKFEYSNSSNTANVKYLYVPFFSVKDSAISYNDEDLKTYLGGHQDEFEKEETKDLKYVTFDVVPSADDTAAVKEEIARLKSEFIDVENDSTFALVNSESANAFGEYTIETLPAQVTDSGAPSVGQVIGPIINNGFYELYKIASSSESEDYSARASHILFKWADESTASKKKAKAQARKILKQIKNGADFAEMARIYGTDGTANNGGDLGWFTQGKKMVKEFDDAVFAVNQEGVLADVVETQFGYHIIDVTTAKSNLKYKVAKVALEIFISDATRNQYYRDAETFALNVSTTAELESLASEQEIKVNTASAVKKNDQRLSILGEARSIIFWAYNKGSLGDVSDVFEINNQYIVATVYKEQSKGPADLERVRFEVENKVKNEKKAELIIKKLNELGEQEDLVQMTTAYGDDGAKFYNMENLKQSSNSLQSVGLAPEAVGVIFSMQSGEKTQPFAIDNGVILIELVEKIEAPEISDYEVFRNQISQKRQGQIAGKVDKAVKKLADIKDDRYKFF